MNGFQRTVKYVAMALGLCLALSIILAIAGGVRNPKNTRALFGFSQNIPTAFKYVSATAVTAAVNSMKHTVAADGTFPVIK